MLTKQETFALEYVIHLAEKAVNAQSADFYALQNTVDGMKAVDPELSAVVERLYREMRDSRGSLALGADVLGRLAHPECQGDYTRIARQLAPDAARAANS